MRARTNINSFGKKSLILASNPEISGIKSLDKALAIQWKNPIIEIGIALYNIYLSDEKPETLRNMILVGNTSDCEFKIEGLTNNKTYYIAVESVSTEGYENASLLEVKCGTPFDIRFIAVGENKSYYTVNLENWIDMNGLITGYAITYGNDRYVVVGKGGKAFYSFDTVKWIEMSGISTKEDLVTVTYGNGRFVCISKYGYSYYSTDGETWISMSGTRTNSDYYSYTYYEVVYANGVFYAPFYYYSQSGDISYSYYFGVKYSQDGIKWEGNALSSDRDSSDKYKRHYSYGGRKIVYINEGYNESKARCSEDGKTWIEMSGMNPGFTCYDIAYGNGKFIAVGYGKSYYSEDGKTWIEMSGLETTAYKKVAYGNGCFITIGGNKAYCSENGKTWIEMSGLDTNCRGIISNNWLN